jgi:hypothetical protein
MRANFLASWQAEVVSKNGIFTLKSWGNRPLMLKKCTFVKNLKKYCDGVDISCSPTITFAEKVDVSFDDISVNLSDGSDVIAGSATISSSGARFDCNFVSKLDNLTKLPMMSQSPSIKSGICSGHVGCTRDGDSLSGSMELRVREFTLKDDATPVDGEGSVLFKRAPDDFQATIDLTLSGEHDTAMSLAVTADEDENTRKTDTKIELRGDSICVSDVINIARIPISVLVPGNALNALWRSQIAYAADVESDDMFFAGEKPRAVAAWSVISGSGVAEVKKIFLSKSLCLDNFECLCSVTDEKIDLKTVNFTVEESQFNLNSKMEFLSENTENQYAFSLYGSLEMANIGKLCRAIDPSGTALLDGEGKMSVQLASNGKNLWDTLKEVRGSVNANCSNGALCLTRLLGKKDRAVAEAIELAGVFLAQKSDKMASANALVNRLKHLEYDEIEISVKRNNSLDIVVDKFSISGPEIYITGNGRVSYVKYKHFKNYPLVLDFCTYAAGELGETMDSLGLIIDKPRNAQYMCGPHFTLGGTVGRINYSDFIRILCQFF